MKNLKTLLWTVVGLVVGAAGVLATNQALPPQQPTKPTPPQRLQVTYAGMALDNSAYFIKDPKSGGCWLALKWQADAMNLTSAPKEACD